PEQRALRQQNRITRHAERFASQYGLVSRSRTSQNVDASQLFVRDSVQLRVLDGPNIGKFLFVPGYSVIGGPDVIPD
ncbi:MAG: hypothetical protein ABFD60_04420, partial [Bryobacteraceae bacterium]